MKPRFPIKKQLIVIILSVTSISTLLAFIFSITHDYVTSRLELRNGMVSISRMIGESCKSTLLFNDSQGANDLLSYLKTNPLILQATIFDTADSVFASYTKSTTHTVFPRIKTVDGSFFNEEGLHISSRIMQENQLFGTLDMHISVEAITSKLTITIGLFFLVFFFIMVISYLVAVRLQKIISVPILELKNLAEKITELSDFSIRIPHTHHNEIGLLQKSFDQMVQQLNKTVISLKNEIRDRIQSQQETLRLRIYLKSIIDSLSSVIIAVDPDGSIKQMNLEAVKFLKCNSDDAIHQPVTSVLTILNENEHFLQACISSRQPQRFPVVIKEPGIAQPNYLSVAIYPLSQNENQGVVIRIDDVTDKTRMEMMMIQNEKMMSLGGLAAGMAHEINNPLGIISQGIQNIIRHVSPDFSKNNEIATECNISLSGLQLYFEKRKINHYLEGMLAASRRASDIVANMLQFSRMSNQSKTPADIRTVIDQTIELAHNEYELKKKFDFRQITVIREYEPTIPDVLCNVTEIQQVILNLLKNAAHALYTIKQDGTIPHIILRVKYENQFAIIEVEDNGPGIAEEYKKRIFEPFFTTKEVGVGTGLGLSVSYFIITKNHSGSITFESTPGIGTRFIIRIPFNPVQGINLQPPENQVIY